MQSLTEDLSFLLDSGRPPLHQARLLASVCGKIISLGNCVGNVARLMTRNTFAVINSAMNWNSLVSLTPDCVDKLNFWKDNLVPLTACLCSPLSVRQLKLSTRMHLIQPAVAIFISKTKCFTKIGQSLRDLKVPRFGSFSLFHCLYRRSLISLVLRPLFGIQITRMLLAL